MPATSTRQEKPSATKRLIVATMQWRAIELLSMTPKPTPATARPRAARGWLIAGAAVASALSLASFVAGAMDGGNARPAYWVLAAFLTGVATALGMTLASATAFRRLTSFGRGALSVLLWIGAPLLVVLAALGTLLALLVGADVFTAQGNDGAAAVASIALLILALELAAMCSAGCVPLLSAERPHPFRAHVAQLGWTIALCALIVATCTLILHYEKTLRSIYNGFDVVATTIALTVALLTAVCAWHARAMAHQRDQRTRVLAALSAASTAIGDADCSAAQKRCTLEALQALVTRDSYESQSPAAPPSAARSEIADFIDAVVDVSAGRTLPDSWAHRTGLDPANGGELFRLLGVTAHSDPDLFLASAGLVISHMRMRLLKGQRRRVGPHERFFRLL